MAFISSMKTDFERKERIEINDDVSPFDDQFRPVPLEFLSHNGQMHHKAFLKRHEVAGLKGSLSNCSGYGNKSV